MATIITKNSSTASSVPLNTQLVQGELAVNVTDKRLFTENASGTVVELGTNPSSLTLPNGTANGVPYLNGSKVLTTGSALTFDGTKLVASGGNEAIRIASGAPYYSFYNAAQTTQFGYIQHNGTDLALVNVQNGAMPFYVNNSEQMRLTSTGLGIGTSSPAGKLSVNVDASTELITFRSSGGRQIWAHEPGANARPLTIKAQTLTYADDTATRFTVDSSGNLGLGVTPSAWSGISGAAFEMKGNAYLFSTTGVMAVGANAFFNGSNWIYRTTQAASRYEQVNGAHQWGVAPSGTAGNAISFTQAMTLDAGGNLLVGATTSGGKLTVQGGGGDVIRANIGTAGSAVIVVGSGSTMTSMYMVTSSGLAGQITNSGTSTTYATSSDYRLKEDIQPMTGALDKVAQLNPVTYNWKADGSAGQGFIAHELQAVVPNCVTGEKDAVDADGNPVYQGIDTSFLVATLTAAIQEQQAIIQTLTARIEALEAK